MEEIVAAWPFEIKEFMRARLNQYTPLPEPVTTMIHLWRRLVGITGREGFSVLRDPELLTDWQKRFEVSGQSSPRKAWNAILAREISSRDKAFLISLLDSELRDVHLPARLATLLDKVYRAHVRKEYIADPEVPQAPLILFIGASGTGKSATAMAVIDHVIFQSEVRPEPDLTVVRERVMGGVPFWQSLEEVAPELAAEISQRRQLRLYRFLARLPLVSALFRQRIARNLGELEEQPIDIDYAKITPNDFQTSLAGEPGNYLRRAFGDPHTPSIRHLEEAHSAFARKENGGGGSGVERQQGTLVDTSNIILDEIISGSRDCLLIATSDQPEVFDTAIYRRFAEKGAVIDVADYWQNREDMTEVVRIELLRHNIRVADAAHRFVHPSISWIDPDDLAKAMSRIYRIFAERALQISPAYVRKLVDCIVRIRGDFAPGHLDDSMLVRSAFEMVARNAFGDLVKKVVNKIDRSSGWDSYVGEVKDTFSEMANNCLLYSVNEEKGVVLNGPPGSGKTFLVRSWLSENGHIHDICVSPAVLNNPLNPIDGTVENLVKVYDIAKMIAPAVVFFDEGDALAPRRSATGGSPADRLTNTFLSIIDGEKPLAKVLTVLTTNRLDLLDPALIRSKRLKVLEVSGQLGRRDISDIISAALDRVPVAAEVTSEQFLESAKGICNTPADFSAFVDKASAQRATELTVLGRLVALDGLSREEQEKFVKLNLKTISGILEALGDCGEVKQALRESPAAFVDRFGIIGPRLAVIDGEDGYPLCLSHLRHARQEMSQNPIRKGKVELDDYLETELSREPQCGFIIGVGASDTEGVLLPIATSLTYNLSPERVLVTGAVSASGGEAAQLEMAVQMTQQSAQEALTLVENYFQALVPQVNVVRLLGEFLGKHTIHHQLLSASYNVGGPSAGYALALNSLSAILHTPICNDFGITGAPWTKGVTSGEVGGSVIIGGQKKKAEKVLQYLRRMYMPRQNYKSLDPEFLIGYWQQDKDILGVTYFGELVPETIWLGPEYDETLRELIAIRIQYKLKRLQHNERDQKMRDHILYLHGLLRQQAENEIIRRLEAIRRYVSNPGNDPFSSIDIFYQQGPPADNGGRGGLFASFWDRLLGDLGR